MTSSTSPKLISFLRRILGLALVVTATFTISAQEQDSTPTPPVKPDEGNLRAFIELVRTDIQTEKATIIAENLPLTEDEAFEFWPLHREYSLELSKLFDQRLSLIRKHVAHF